MCLTRRPAAESWLISSQFCPCLLDSNSELESPSLHVHEGPWASKCPVTSGSHSPVAHIPLCLPMLQAAKPPDLNPETEESIPSRSSPEGPDPPVLTEVSKQEEQQPLDLEGVKRKMDQGGYTSVVCPSFQYVCSSHRSYQLLYDPWCS